MSKSFEEEFRLILSDLANESWREGHNDEPSNEVGYWIKEAEEQFKQLIRKHRPEKTSQPNHNFGADHQTGLNEGYNAAIDDYDRNLGL